MLMQRIERREQNSHKIRLRFILTTVVLLLILTLSPKKLVLADSVPVQETPSTVTFHCFGDNLLHMGIVRYGQYHGDNFDFLFSHVKDEINNADVAVLNQETPVTLNPARYHGYPKFGSPVSVIDAAARAGFDILTCATNHAVDQGWEGIETLTNKIQTDYPDQLIYLGVNTSQKEFDTIKTIQVNGITVALLNYTYGTNGIPLPDQKQWCVNILGPEEKIRTDIRRAHEIADAVVVFAHWGTEYRYQPDDKQLFWAKVFTEEDVDVVVGGHPHVVEPYEMRTNTDGHQTLIYYSDGNFISSQGTPARCLGGMPSFTLQKTEGGIIVSSYTMEPVVTHQTASNGTTAYLLKDYTPTLAAQHRLHITLPQMQQLFDNIMDGKQGVRERK